MFGNGRSGAGIRFAIVDSTLFLSNHHRPNAALLVPHRSGLVFDDPSLLHEREGLSILKSLRWLPAVAGVKRTSVDVPAKRAKALQPMGSSSFLRCHGDFLLGRRTAPLLKMRHGLWVPALISAFLVDHHPPLYRREHAVLEVVMPDDVCTMHRLCRSVVFDSVALAVCAFVAVEEAPYSCTRSFVGWWS